MANILPRPGASGSRATAPQNIQEIRADTILKSTPSNRGSASVAEYLTSTLVEEISPGILADLKNHATITVEALLNALLVLCLPTERKANPPPHLLDLCLQSVLPICNASVPQKSKKAKQQNTDGEMIRKYLFDYCTKGSDEKSRYEPFILAFNHALRALGKLDNLPLRPQTDLELLFHQNDPKSITGDHEPGESHRKPDIVLVPLNSARNAYKIGDLGQWDDYALNTATEHPARTFEWNDTYLTAEFKRTGNISAFCPVTYTHQPPQSLDPQPIPRHETVEGKVTFPSDRSEPTPPITREASSSSSMKPVQGQRRSQRQLEKKPGSASLGSSDSLGSLGEKRKHEKESDSSSKRQKQTLKKMPAMVQSALYATERLCHAFWISHAINLVIIDDIAYLWWCDRQGAIQSYGINFVLDLPYFLVLLACFQRLSPDDWGIVSTFRRVGKDGRAHFTLPASGNSPAVDVTANKDDKLRGHLGLVGRGTHVLGAMSNSVDPRDVRKNLKGVDLIMKVYWPQESRVAEEDIIKVAQRIGATNENVKGHIPDLVRSHDFVEYSTDTFRKLLGFRTDRVRILRVMLSRRLYPITDLVGDEFWKAFWECFRCHRHLWMGGVEHNDISVSNLMYDKLNGNRGVLNDFDLAHLKGRSRPSGTDRTGTMPFMALDLLTKAAWDGKVEKLYRHDCESFIWALVWICCRYDKGREIPNPPLKEFITSDYIRCSKEKITAFQLINEITPTASYKHFWSAALELLRWPVRRRFAEDVNDQDDPNSRQPEPTVDGMTNICREILKRKGFQVDL